MFDVIKSSYYLQEQFTNVELQTKDMEPDIGGTMTHYWICPNGVLWRPDYTGTNTFEIIEEDDERYNPKHLFLNYEWVPTGQRGKYRVYPITKYIVVYPSDWKGKWEDWPRLRLHFKRGIMQDYENVTGR